MHTGEFNHHAHPVELLRSEYLSRRKSNKNYSLSAFARDLGLSVSFLSRLLRGERSVTVNQVIQIGTILGLSSAQVDSAIKALIDSAPETSKISKKFISAMDRKSNSTNKVTLYEVERFKAISEWYHFAILNLTLVKDFKSNPVHIAKRLGITRVEAEDAIHRLINLGLLQKIDGRLQKTHASLLIKTTKSERAVREFTKQTMDRARAVLENTSQDAFENRCMPGMTLPIDLTQLPILKERLLKFQQEFVELSKSTAYDEVYQINLHFFPLTQMTNKKGDSNEN